MKFLLYSIATLFFAYCAFLGVQYYYLQQWKQGMIEWHRGEVMQAISYFEGIPAIIKPEAKLSLFEIYINKHYSFSDPEKAYSYIKDFDTDKQKVVIESALNSANLAPPSYTFLVNKLAEFQ